MSKAWPPDFPKVMHFVDHQNLYGKPWVLLENDPDYDAAKNHNDPGAGARLVRSFFNAPESRDQNNAQLKEIGKKFPNAIIVPVRAKEENDKNCLAMMLAEYMGKHTGLKVDQSIVQSNEVHRTHKDEWHRFAFRPKFDGPVEKGRQYILVDDVSTLGGTFNELRRHIEKGGGKVVQTAALSLGGHGDDLALRPGLRHTLIGKFGKENMGEFMQRNNLYGGDFEYLTQPEAIALRKLPSLEKADRLIAKAKENVNEPQQIKSQSKQRGGLEW
jgi:hypothetical protein